MALSSHFVIIHQNHDFNNFLGPENFIILTDFELSNSYNLQNFEGLNNLITVLQISFEIHDTSLTSFKGWDSLREVYRFTIRRNNVLINFVGLEKLEIINGELGLQSSDNVKDFTGLERLTSIGSVSIDFCKKKNLKV